MADNAHFPNITSALVDVHRLLAIFQASESIAGLELAPPTRQMFDDIERDEIARILINVSATARLVGERALERAAKNSTYILLFGPMGTLVPDIGQPDRVQELGLREACNKVLHSRRIDPVRRSLASGSSVLDGRVQLFGTKDTCRWMAEIHVAPFCNTAAFALKFLTGQYEGARLPDPAE